MVLCCDCGCWRVLLVDVFGAEQADLDTHMGEANRRNKGYE